MQARISCADAGKSVGRNARTRNNPVNQWSEADAVSGVMSIQALLGGELRFELEQLGKAQFVEALRHVEAHALRSTPACPVRHQASSMDAHAPWHRGAFHGRDQLNSDSLDGLHRDLRYGWAFDERAACEAAIHG